MLLDKNFQSVMPIDQYESFIWTDRYSEYGDFELYTSPSKENLTKIKQGYYIWSDESEHVMIVENLQIDTDAEYGHSFIVTGRSLESLLLRRIVWNQIELDGKLQGQIKRLFTDNVIAPTIPERKITNFIFEEDVKELITETKINAQFTGDTLYDATKKICDIYNIGFKITLNDRNEFVFRLYSGDDRSYEQTSFPYVVFSTAFDNIINSSYQHVLTNYRNLTLVLGEGEGAERKRTVVGDTKLSGIERREYYTDARDLSSRMDDGENMAEADYIEKLKQRGEEKLSEITPLEAYSGEVETKNMYQYGRDFFMGDIVQLENPFGIESRVRVKEFIFSDGKSGVSRYPTFEFVEEAS